MSPGPTITVGGREGGRVHKMTLVKPDQASYGFSIRGGVEHQLGIFVSEVEIGSEAHNQVTCCCWHRQKFKEPPQDLSAMNFILWRILP